MIYFGGFSIEKAIARGGRMTYHCKKVPKIDTVFAGIEERTKPKITNVDMKGFSKVFSLGKPNESLKIHLHFLMPRSHSASGTTDKPCTTIFYRQFA
jgi:hypothetical protein